MEVSRFNTLSTGNLAFVLPRISAPPGGVDRVAFLLLAQRGLVELGALDGPVLSADGTVDGQPLFAAAVADLYADWIPVYRCTTPRYEARLVWLAPHDERGWAARISLRNTGDTSLAAHVAFRFGWARTGLTTYDTEPWHGHLRLMPDGWGGGSGLGFVTDRTQFGVGIGCSPGGRTHLEARDPQSRAVLWSGAPHAGPAQDFPPDASVCVTCSATLTLGPGESDDFELFMSAAPDTKAACLSARYLREQGFAKLLQTTVERLGAMNASLPAALQADPDLGPLARRNRLFCYFYSLGRTLDTEELCPVTSRSRDYYVSAAYWDRDVLLWSFPTILDLDPPRAAEMLAVAFGRQFRNVGVHSRFITGAVYEPGFQLDELCAPLLALERYLAATGDWDIVSQLPLDSALAQIETTLKARRHRDVSLYSTDYLPTDDIAQLPYSIYDNVLVWRLCGAAARIESFRERFDGAHLWADRQHAVAAAIAQHGIVLHDGRPLYAWTVDLAGRHRLDDEPPGSLTLLAALGFVSPDDPVYRNTCAWIYSPANPHYFAAANEIGCAHEPHPWVLAVANSLLVPQRRAAALALLRRLPMDDGLACEAVDEHTGVVVSGRHFATCAGYLCHALRTAFTSADSPAPAPAFAPRVPAPAPRA